MTKKDAMRLFGSAVLVLLFFTTLAFPQGAPTRAITGIVKDSKGASVPGAQVELYNEQTGWLERSVKTESDGSYTATLLRWRRSARHRARRIAGSESSCGWLRWDR